jgi:hypothetical protein
MMNLVKLQTYLPEILGKTIEGVLLCHRPGAQSEMFLVFDDGTHYKFYGIERLDGSKGVDPGGIDVARRYADGRGADIREVTRDRSGPGQ